MTAPAVWSRDLSERMFDAFTRSVGMTDDVMATLSEMAKTCEASVREHLADLLDEEAERTRVGWRARSAECQTRRQVVMDMARWLRGEIVLAAVGHIHPDEATVARVAVDFTEVGQLSDDTGPSVLVAAWARAGRT